MVVKFKVLKNSVLLGKLCTDKLYPVPHIFFKENIHYGKKNISKMQFVSCQFILTWKHGELKSTYCLLFKQTLGNFCNDSYSRKLNLFHVYIF